MEPFMNRAERTAAKKKARTPAEALEIAQTPLVSVLLRAQNAEEAQKHVEKCKKAALFVKNKQCTLKLASQRCNISQRQMLRYIAKLVPDEV